MLQARRGPSLRAIASRNIFDNHIAVPHAASEGFPGGGAMDIDEILAEIDAPSISKEQQDLEELTRLWIAEKAAPEILPWPSNLMERIGARIRTQIELVEEQTGDMDPKASFRLIIIQTELERFKFLARSYLRARLAKLDMHLLYYIALTQSSLLSPSELAYAKSHQALLERHYRAAFLSQLPPSLQRLDDSAGGIAMVEAPDVDRAVFVRARENTGLIAVEGTDIEFELEKGEVAVVRWSAVATMVADGDIELL